MQGQVDAVMAVEEGRVCGMGYAISGRVGGWRVFRHSELCDLVGWIARGGVGPCVRACDRMAEVGRLSKGVHVPVDKPYSNTMYNMKKYSN